MRKVNKMAKKRYNSKTLPKVEKGKIHIVNMSSYTRPEIKEQYNRDWVEYGDDNNYFSYLILQFSYLVGIKIYNIHIYKSVSCNNLDVLT